MARVLKQIYVSVSKILFRNASCTTFFLSTTQDNEFSQSNMIQHHHVTLRIMTQSDYKCPEVMRFLSSCSGTALGKWESPISCPVFLNMKVYLSFSEPFRLRGTCFVVVSSSLTLPQLCLKSISK